MVPLDSKSLQRFVLRSGGVPPLGWLYRACYRAGQAWILRDWPRRFPEIARVDVRRGLASADWLPGASDLDLRVVLRGRPADELRFLGEFWSRYRAQKRLLPFLGETQIVDPADAAWVAEFGGAREREAADPERRAWERLHESLSSCLFLLQDAYFGSDERSSPDFRHKLAKGYLDAARFAAASRGGASGPVPSRRDWTGRDRGEPVELCCRAVGEVDAACAEFVSAAERVGRLAEAAPNAPARWPSDLPNSELLVWKGRMRTLDRGGLPKVHGLYYDGMLRWLLVADAGDRAELARLFEHVRRWRAEDPVFGPPPSIVSKAMFQLLLWTPYLDSPFLYWSLSPDLHPLGLEARRRARSPLLAFAQRAQWRITAGDFLPPPRSVLGWSLELSAANLALSLRLFGLDGWAGDNAYRVGLLYGRLLSARLYRQRGEAFDPDDLDSLVEAARALPEFARVEAPLRAVLDTPTSELNARAPREVFERHYPAWRLLLDGLLASR